MEPKYVKINGFVYGVYRPENFEYGRNGIRKKLCLESEAVRKPGARRDRTPEQIDKFLRKLWHKKLQELLSEKNRPKKDGPGIKIKEAFQLFIDDKQGLGEVGQQTIDNYARTFTIYIKAISNHAVNRYQKHYQTRFIKHLREREYNRTSHTRKGLQSSTVNAHLSRMNAFFLWAHEMDLAVRQHKMKRVKPDTKMMTAYTWERQVEIEHAIRNEIQTCRPYDRPMRVNLLRMFMMVTETGMRQSEARSLSLNRINLNARKIEIRKVSDIGFDPKNRRERDISISDYLLEFLKLDLSTRENDRWYLDINGKQAFKDANAAASALRNLLIKYNLRQPGIRTWHGFRSRVITVIAEKVGLVQAQKNAGHASIKTTGGYIDSSQIDTLEAVNVLREKQPKTHIKITSVSDGVPE